MRRKTLVISLLFYLLIPIGVSIGASDPDSTNIDQEAVVIEKLDQALLAYQSGEYKRVKDILDQLDPGTLDQNNLITLSGLYLRIGDPDRALTVIGSSLSESSDPGIMVVAGLAFDAKGQQHLADYWLQFASNSDSSNISVKISYIDWLAKQEKYGEAYSWLSKKLEVFPVYSPWLLRYTRFSILYGKPSSAIKIIKLHQKGHPLAHWMLSILHTHLNQREEALHSAELALEANPENEKLRAGVEQLLQKNFSYLASTKQWSQAERAADLMVSMNTQNFDSHENRLRLPLMKGDYAAAEILVSQWTHLNPAQRSSLSGDIAMARGEFENANQYYNEAWRLIPNLSLLGRINQVQSRLDLNQIPQFVGDWISGEPNNPDALLADAMLASSAADPSMAIEKYSSLIEHHPNYWAAHNNLAWLYVESKQYIVAIEHANTAVQLNPESAQIIDTLAWIYHLNGESEQAKEWISKALLIAPENSKIQEHAKLIHEQ